MKTVIGRIVTANPFEGERYFMRILLNHVRGPLSFEDLRTVEGILAPTFCEAATMHGLLQRDSSLEDCLHEASLYQMSSSLRRLFATILVYCNPTNPRDLWERFEEDMSIDFKSSEDSTSTARYHVLRSISSTIESMGKNINSYHLLDEDISFDGNEFQSREINDELGVEILEEDITSSRSLNSVQQQVYNVVLEKVLSNQNAAFFVDGPGGIGKTFLYRVLLKTVRSRNLVALATASSGVATSILPGGRTAHSRFKLPLDTDEKTTCCVSKQSALANLLHAAKLIIWDETSMTRKQHIEALNKMLQDINDSDVAFGGKVVVFGGDFQQVLPVVRKGTRQEQVNSSLVHSYLWPTLSKFRLTENMRARLDPMFSNYVLAVGNGLPPTTKDEIIKIPNGMLVSYDDDKTSLDHLIQDVFHNIKDYSGNMSTMMNRAILTPKNSFVDEINALLIQRFPGEAQRYYSVDETIDKTEQSVMEDFLNTLTPNGLPPHELLLKEHCPIMLLRNINPSEGLCNGTRLICRAFDRNIIDAEIVVGHHMGKRVFIPRIPFLPNVADNSDFLAVAIQIESTKEITTKFQQQTIQEIYLIDERANNNTLKIKSIIETSLTHPSTTLSSIGLQKTVKICDIPCAMKTLQSMEKKYFWIEAKINIIDSVQIARAYVQLKDDTGKLDVVMFGEVVEETFGSSAVQLMENSTQEIPQHIESVANKLATKKWTIKLSGDEEKMNYVKYKHFIILSIEAKQDNNKDESSS
ncbi:uncharacterized protein LOC133814833 [Humulus lupulus]|uniref:uncharacterized protein LOC133814833 n=1 Tax=Humulus lupulus TaxID=3486 RepID=UPI002B403A68|nr:uncharacterized protein LOC133814833 [Humulus lupulus]